MWKESGKTEYEAGNVENDNNIKERNEKETEGYLRNQMDSCFTWLR